MKLLRKAARRARVAGSLLRAALSKDRPLLVQIIPMRRCNLACAYCVEYDHSSEPVPLALMRERIDRLAELGTALVTISGGEPMMHPELTQMIAHIRKRGMVATLITNGYYLSVERIQELNRAGLDHLQISIDNLEPDEVSLKSLRLLEPKLRFLAAHAEFEVNINTVLGGGVRNPQDALAIARRARELGFSSSVGLLDGHGREIAAWAEDMLVYRELKALRDWTSWFNGRWQDNVAEGKSNDWKCRAGARYLYIDEFGRVQYCSMQRGAPDLPLASYGIADLRREFSARKDCAPYCTINCVQQASWIDAWRGPQRSVARTVSLVIKPSPRLAPPEANPGTGWAAGTRPGPAPR